MLQPGLHIHDPRLQRRKTMRRAQIPPDLRGVLDHAQVNQGSCRTLIFSPTVEQGRQARPGQVVEHRQTVTGEPGIVALPIGGRRRQRQEMGQKVGKLWHEIGAQGVVFQTDVNMHSTDQHTSRHAAQCALQVAVAFLVGMGLVFPISKWMTGNRNRREIIVASMFGHDRAQPAQIVPCFGDCTAHT